MIAFLDLNIYMNTTSAAPVPQNFMLVSTSTHHGWDLWDSSSSEC